MKQLYAKFNYTECQEPLKNEIVNLFNNLLIKCRVEENNVELKTAVRCYNCILNRNKALISYYKNMLVNYSFSSEEIKKRIEQLEKEDIEGFRVEKYVFFNIDNFDKMIYYEDLEDICYELKAIIRGVLLAVFIASPSLAKEFRAINFFYGDKKISNFIVLDGDLSLFCEDLEKISNYKDPRQVFGWIVDKTAYFGMCCESLNYLSALSCIINSNINVALIYAVIGLEAICETHDAKGNKKWNVIKRTKAILEDIDEDKVNKFYSKRSMFVHEGKGIYDFGLEYKELDEEIFDYSLYATYLLIKLIHVLIENDGTKFSFSKDSNYKII